VIEVYDGFMLDISDLGTVVDMVFAVTAMFCDRIMVLFFPEEGLPVASL
jgi:hypothetical protein